MAQKFTITAQLNLKAGNIGQVVKQLQSQFQGANVNFNIQQMTAAQAQLKKVGTSAQSASKSVNGLAKNISDAAKRFSALTIATGTFVGLARAIKNAVGDAIEFQREVVKIAQATGQSTSSLKGLEQEITRVSTTLGVSSKELLVAARNLTQAGFAANKVKGALDLLAKTELAATFDSISDTTEGVIAILNQFGRAAQKNGTEIQFLEKSLSAINQVSKDFAVESSDLITAVRTTGSAFESAGGSLDELLALFTSVRATTRESAESISTGFRTIFTRTQRVDTINNLKKLGIELQDAEGKFVGPIEATRRLSTALNSIDPRDFRFNVIVEELGGFRQVSKVIPLIQQFGVATKALSIAQKSSGSLSKDAVTAQEALAVQIAKVREEFLAFIRDLTGSSTFQSTISGLLKLSSAFIQVADSVKPLLPLIGTFGAMKLGLNFLPSINQSLTRRKAAGGKIYGFAGGGMVPGSGNGDTVPAMLSPGEFVIRKSSVKKIGADNLARVNKYAGGGRIIGNLGGVASKTSIFEDGKNLGLQNDTFKVSVRRKKVPIAKSVYDNLEKDGKGWENYLAKTYGYKQYPSASGEKNTESDYRYPIDMESSSSFIDAKDFSSTSAVKIEEGYKKALSHLLYQKYKSQYKFQGANKNTINTGDDSFYGTKLTEAADAIQSPKNMLLLFPDVQKRNTGGFITLHPSKPRVSKAKLDKFNIKYPDGQMGDPNHEITFTEGVWDASFDVSKPQALDYFVRSIHESSSQKAAMQAYAKSKGKSESQIYNLLQGQNADWFEDRVHDEIGGTLAGGNYYVDILKAQKTIQGDVDVKDTKVREPISEFVQKAYKNAAWEYVNGISKQDPRTAQNLSISSVTTNTKDPVFGKSLKQAIADMTSKTASKQTVALLEKLGLTRPTFTDVDKVVNSATFKERATEYGGKKLYNLGTYDTGKKVYDELAKKYRKEAGFPKIDALSAILGMGVKADTNLSDQQVAIIQENFRNKYGYARGGSAGTDTVPALLTPGEFVINRKSAQKIGYSSLNRMNQVGKFANGGIVPQRMGFGGIKTAAQAGTKATALMQSQNVTFASTKGASALDKVFQQIEKDSGNLTAAFKILTSEINKNKNGQLKVTKGLVANLKEAGKQEPKDLSNKLLLLSTAAGSLTAQFTTLPPAIQSGVTSLITSFGLVKTSVSSAGDTFKEFGGKSAIFGEALKKASLSVALLQAGIQATAAYYNTNLEKSTEKLDKSFEDLASGKGNAADINKNVNDISNSLEVLNSSFLNRTGSLTAIGGGTIGGAVGSLGGAALGTALTPILGPIGPVIGQQIGSLLGSTAGTYIGAAIDKYWTPPIANGAQEIKNLAAQSIASTNTLNEFNKGLEKLDKQTIGQLTGQVSAISRRYADQSKVLKQSQEALKNANPDEIARFQNSINRSQEELKNLKEAAQKTSAAISVKSQKELSDLINTNVIPSLQDLDQRAKAIVTRDLYDDQKKYQEALKTSKDDLVTNTAQLLRQRAAIKSEQEARNSLIGTLEQEKAIKDATAKVNFELEKLSSVFAAKSSVFDDGFKSFENISSISKALDLNAPVKEFIQGLNIVSNALGQDGPAFAKNLLDLRNTSNVLNPALQEIANLDLGQNIDFEKYFKTYLGSKGINNPEIVKRLNDIIQKQRTGVTKGNEPGPAGAIDITGIAEEFEKYRKELTDQLKGIVDALSTYDQKLNQELSNYAQSIQKLTDYQLKTSDRFKSFNDILSQATARRVTLEEKENFRRKKLGLLGATNPKDLAKQLGEAQNAKFRLIDEKRSGLIDRKAVEQNSKDLMNASMAADKAKNALEALADQSDKTSDILGEIERLRGQREAVQGLTRQFAFGGDEERKNIATSIQALNAALTANNLDAIPEELRSSVGQLLDQFKDVPIFGGLTGENISKNFQFQELIKSGVAPQFAQSIFGQSTPEQKLITELQKTFMQEEEARRILADREFQQQSVLIDNISALNGTFDQYILDIRSGKQGVQGNIDSARTALVLQGVQPAIQQSADALSRAATALEIQAGLKPAQKRAKGGLIYRAGGGSIFQPQGTDTVPAMLTPGEYVIRKDAVDSIGVDTLNQINGYAGGGIVGFRNQQFGQQMAARNNMFYNQMMAGPDVASQFETMGSYYNMTRLSPKQRREMSGGGQQAQAVAPAPERRRGIDVRNIDRKFERESAERRSEIVALNAAANVRNRRIEAGISYNQSIQQRMGGSLMNSVGSLPNSGPMGSKLNMGSGSDQKLAAQYIARVNATGPLDVNAESRKAYEQSTGRKIAGYGGFLSGIPIIGNLAGGISSLATGATDLYMGTQTVRGVAQNAAMSFIGGKALGFGAQKAKNYIPSRSSIYNKFYGYKDFSGSGYLTKANKYGNTFQESMRSVSGKPPIAVSNYKVDPRSVYKNMSEAEYEQLKAQSRMRGFAKGGLVGGTRLKRFAEGGPVGGEGLGGDMSGGFNVEALMGVANTFAAFTESMSKISETLNGLTMQHQVTIDGQLNLNGINSVEIAEVIKNQVGTFIANEVSRVMQSERMKP